MAKSSQEPFVLEVPANAVESEPSKGSVGAASLPSETSGKKRFNLKSTIKM